MTANLVDTHTLVQAVDAKLADWKRRRDDFEARVAPIAAEDEKAEQEYRAAVDAALLEGAPMPEPPVRRLPQGRDVEIRLNFMQEQQQLIEERRKAVADAYGDVLREARSQARKLVAAARPTLEKLTASMIEAGELLAAVKVCRDARNSVARDSNGDSRMGFNDSPLTVEQFVRLVAEAGNPIDLVDLAGTKPARDRNFGMTSGEVQQLIEARPGKLQPQP